MDILTGILLVDGYVKTDNGELFILPIRGTDENGFPEVLINAKQVGGSGEFKRQSIQPYIGMKVQFAYSGGNRGYNFTIVK
jgi:hypothetical protein